MKPKPVDEQKYVRDLTANATIEINPTVQNITTTDTVIRAVNRRAEMEKLTSITVTTEKE